MRGKIIKINTDDETAFKSDTEKLKRVYSNNNVGTKSLSPKAAHRDSHKATNVSIQP